MLKGSTLRKYQSGGSLIDTNKMRDDLSKDSYYFKDGRYTRVGKRRLAAIQEIENNQDKGLQYNIDKDSGTFTLTKSNTGDLAETNTGTGLGVDENQFSLFSPKKRARKEVSKALSGASDYIKSADKPEENKGIDKELMESNRFTNIKSLYNSGITDPREIQASLYRGAKDKVSLSSISELLSEFNSSDVSTPTNNVINNDGKGNDNDKKESNNEDPDESLIEDTKPDPAVNPKEDPKVDTKEEPATTEFTPPSTEELLKPLVSKLSSPSIGFNLNDAELSKLKFIDKDTRENSAGKLSALLNSERKKLKEGDAYPQSLTNLETAIIKLRSPEEGEKYPEAAVNEVELDFNSIIPANLDFESKKKILSTLHQKKYDLESNSASYNETSPISDKIMELEKEIIFSDDLRSVTDDDLEALINKYAIKAELMEEEYSGHLAALQKEKASRNTKVTINRRGGILKYFNNN